MDPVYDRTDQIALITSESLGIGLMTVKAFTVVLVNINENALPAAAKALTSARHRTIDVTCVVS